MSMKRQRRIIPFAWLLAALLTTVACSDGRQAVGTDPEMAAVDELLKSGQMAEAREFIDQLSKTACDSDDHYRYEVMRSKYFFSAMSTDSFGYYVRRLNDYLKRRQGKSTVLSRRLAMENELQLGVYESRMTGNMEAAIGHYERALEMIDISDDAELESKRLIVFFNLADAYKQEGAFDQAVGYYRRAMELGDEIGMTPDSEIALNIGIASAYTSMHSFDQSNEWWEKARAQYDQMRPTDRFFYLNNRGNDLYLQERYAESLKYFVTLDSLMADRSDMEWERMFGHANLADVHLKLGHLAEAHRYLEEAQAFFDRQQLTVVLYYLYTQRIDLATKEGRLDDALRLVNNDTLAGKTMLPEQVLLRLRVLSSLYAKTGQWQLSNQCNQQYYQLRDSIASDRMKMRFSTALIDYEHNKRLYEKEKEVEEHKLRMRFVASLFVIAVLVIVMLSIIIVQRRRQRKLREMALRGTIASLRMETIRNRITPHFMSNALSAEVLAQMEGRPVDLDTLVQLLHRGIEMTGTEQITLHDELEFIRFYCKVESRSVGPDFRLEVCLSPDVDDRSVLLPSMAIQILVENAIKHGLKRKAQREGHFRQVTIKASRQGEGTLVEVIDNGVGIDSAHPSREHIGLMVMRKTLLLLNEQEQAAHGHHAVLMDFALENYTHLDGDSGCRAWLFLPDGFRYTLQTPQPTIHT